MADENYTEAVLELGGQTVGRQLTGSRDDF